MRPSGQYLKEVCNYDQFSHLLGPEESLIGSLNFAVKNYYNRN